jgi:hypothetical protein
LVGHASHTKPDPDPKKHHCAKATRLAVEAGGVTLAQTLNAKDYGASLLKAGFSSLGQMRGGYLPGDVVINSYHGDRPGEGSTDGHMAMFSGKIWISDWRQHYDVYPGPGYKRHKIRYVVYRYGSRWMHLLESMKSSL